MIAINDDYADGQDVSWLYDVSFESLQERGVALTSGVRAYDMALRLDYDEVAVAAVEPDLDRALDRLIREHPAEPRRIFCTYTAMMRLPAARSPLRAGRLRGGARMTSKGTIDLVHLYPREMSIYGDLGNTRCLAQRIRRHGYEVRVHNHEPGATSPRHRTCSWAAVGRTRGRAGSRTTSRSSATACGAWPPTEPR